MDIILGIKLNDSVLFATSKAATRGISVLKASDDKTKNLGEHTAIAYTGESGDTGMCWVHEHIVMIDNCANCGI